MPQMDRIHVNNKSHSARGTGKNGPGSSHKSSTKRNGKRESAARGEAVAVGVVVAVVLAAAWPANSRQ
jgi:hypothetical protein